MSPPLRLAARLAGLVALSATLGCPRAPTPTADAGATGASAAGRTLSQDDTRPLADGRWSSPDGGWTIALPPGAWRLVSDEARARLQANADSWVLEPSTMTHATVTCAGERAASAADLPATLRARSASLNRGFRLDAVRAVEGPWLRGAVARFETSDGQATRRHALAAYDLGGTGCEVQAWVAATDAGATDALEALVLAFVPHDARALGAAGRLLRRLRETPSLEARAAERVDAGVAPTLAVATLVAEGLPRLAVPLLEERFALRFALLNRLDDDTCGALVVHSAGEAAPWFEQLTDDEAERWAAISEAALVAAASSDGRRVVEPRDVEAAEAALVRRQPQLAGPLEVLKNVDKVPLATVCASERARLAGALKLPEAQRLTLYRAWLGGAR